MNKRTVTVTVVLGMTMLVLLTGCGAINSPPIASFTATPTLGTAPLSVSFNAARSSDPDGDIVSYTCSFGDGRSGSGITISHTFNTPGTFTVRLTVTDNRGARDSTSRSITVKKAPQVGYHIIITASESEIDILSYEIEHEWLHEWLMVILVGRAKNITGRTIGGVLIRARLLDEDGVQIAITAGGAFDVLPDMIFEFRLLIFEAERVKTIEIYEITTW